MLELDQLEQSGITCVNCEYFPCSNRKTLPLCIGYEPKWDYEILPEREYIFQSLGMPIPTKYKAIPVLYKDIEFQIIHNGNGFIGKCNLPNMPVYIATKYNKRNGVTVKITGYNSLRNCIHAIIERYESSIASNK